MPTPLAIHHLSPTPRRARGRQTTGRAGVAPWRALSRWLRQLALALSRRPLLALTLIVASLLQMGAVGEMYSRGRIEDATRAAAARNAALRVEITRIDAQTRQRADPATIRATARGLGWVVAP